MTAATSIQPVARDAPASVVRITAAVIGVVLLAVGLSGFFGFGLAGNPDTHPVFITGLIQDLGHIITGSLALYVAFGFKGRQAAIRLVLFGALFLVILLVSLNNDNMYGLLQNAINQADNVLHGLIALIAFAVGGWALARGSWGGTTA